MEIPFSWLKDNGDTIDHADSLKCSESALLWAALTVGAPSHAVWMQNIMEAPVFALHKWFAIRSVVDFRDDEIKVRDSYHILDPSEKGVLSYWTGMIFAKLVGEQILRAPWMSHARLMKESGVLHVTPPKTKSLPDLVGYGDSPDFGLGWHVLEAKGFQNNPSIKNRQHYKDQISVVESVHGENRITRNYCITYLRSPFSIELCDPEEVTEESIKIDVTPQDLQKFYYSPFYAYFKDENNESGIITTEHFLYKKIRYGPSCKMHCCIGIDREVFEKVENWERRDQAKIDRGNRPLKNIDVSELRKDELFSEGDYYIGSDGIFVQLL